MDMTFREVAFASLSSNLVEFWCNSLGGQLILVILHCHRISLSFHIHYLATTATSSATECSTSTSITTTTSTASWSSQYCVPLPLSCPHRSHSNLITLQTLRKCSKNIFTKFFYWHPWNTPYALYWQTLYLIVKTFFV